MSHPQHLSHSIPLYLLFFFLPLAVCLLLSLVIETALHALRSTLSDLTLFVSHNLTLQFQMGALHFRKTDGKHKPCVKTDRPLGLQTAIAPPDRM